MSIAGLSGQKLAGLYKLMAPIAHGAHSVLYDARHAESGARLVVKVFYPEILSPEGMVRCRRDSDMAAALRHPAIVRVLDWSPRNAQPRVFCVTNYLVCEDVRARLRRVGRLTPHQVLELGLRVGVVLSAAHKLGITHRGLTPRNLVYTQAGPDALEQGEVVKVLDFGVGHLPAATGRDQDNLPYRAPEQQTGADGDADPRTDQFALAVILYEALAGRPPPLHDEVALLDEDSSTLLEDLCPDAPAHMVRAIQRGLSPIRSDRFSSIMDFIRALDDRGLSPFRGSSATPRSSVSRGRSAPDAPSLSSTTPRVVTPDPSPGPLAEPMGVIPPSANTFLPITVQASQRRRSRRVWTTVTGAILAVAGVAYLGFGTRAGSGGAGGSGEDAFEAQPTQRPMGQAPSEERPGDRSGGPRPSPDEEARAAIGAAEQALLKGEDARALELARGGMATEPGAAWRIIATAACRLNDTRLLAEALTHLSSADGDRVRATCQRP